MKKQMTIYVFIVVMMLAAPLLGSQEESTASSAALDVANPARWPNKIAFVTKECKGARHRLADCLTVSNIPRANYVIISDDHMSSCMQCLMSARNSMAKKCAELDKSFDCSLDAFIKDRITQLSKKTPSNKRVVAVPTVRRIKRLAGELLPIKRVVEGCQAARVCLKEYLVRNGFEKTCKHIIEQQEKHLSTCAPCLVAKKCTCPIAQQEVHLLTCAPCLMFAAQLAGRYYSTATEKNAQLDQEYSALQELFKTLKENLLPEEEGHAYLAASPAMEDETAGTAVTMDEPLLPLPLSPCPYYPPLHDHLPSQLISPVGTQDDRLTLAFDVSSLPGSAAGATSVPATNDLMRSVMMEEGYAGFWS